MRCRLLKGSWIGLTLAIALLSASPEVRADDTSTPNGGSPYKLKLWYDTSFIFLAGAGRLPTVGGLVGVATCAILGVAYCRMIRAPGLSQPSDG